MAATKSRLKPWLIAFGVVIGFGFSMMTTAIVVLALYHDDWPPHQAEVISTWIERSREGALTWSLKADIFL